MRAPAVEIVDILGQDLLEMALIEYKQVVQALRPDRSHPALGDRVGPRRSERRVNLGNTETTHPPIEAGVFDMEAKKYNVYPLDSSFASREIGRAHV